MLAAPWLGTDKMFDGPPSGVVRTFDAPAAGAYGAASARCSSGCTWQPARPWGW